MTEVTILFGEKETLSFRWFEAPGLWIGCSLIITYQSTKPACTNWRFPYRFPSADNETAVVAAVSKKLSWILSKLPLPVYGRRKRNKRCLQMYLYYVSEKSGIPLLRFTVADLLKSFRIWQQNINKGKNDWFYVSLL